VLAGDEVFLDVGTHAAIPNVPGLEAAKPLTHVEALELDYLPPHLIVIGGGYSGLELAQAFRRFGSDVTIIEARPSDLPARNPQASRRWWTRSALRRSSSDAGATQCDLSGSGTRTRARLRPVCSLPMSGHTCRQ
jgi:pyruvate/2-oxoglutarate dehydrogenase complex dihydrolipoamide dehydrogenase (E3) component